MYVSFDTDVVNAELSLLGSPHWRPQPLQPLRTLRIDVHLLIFKKYDIHLAYIFAIASSTS